MNGQSNHRLLVAFVLTFLVFSGCKTLVKFESSPAGAKVQEATLPPLGTTPGEHELRRRGYSFVFTLPGYREQRLERRVGGREMIVHAELEELRTTLDIRTLPSSADVLVTWQGREVDLGNTRRPHNAINLDHPSLWGSTDTTTFHVVVTAPGYNSVADAVQLARYEARTLSYALTEQRTEISIGSDPPGADVFDRSLGYLGRTPFSTFIPGDQLARIAARRDQQGRDLAQLQLSCVRKGYRTSERVEWVTVDGKDNHITFDLESE